MAIAWVSQFNNFAFRLPNDENEGAYREVIKQQGNLDKTYKETFPFNVFGEPDDFKGYSQLYINQTRREFFDTIDRVIKETGISVSRIKKLQGLRNKPGIKKDSWQVLYKLVFPVYKKLREMGYTNADLRI